MVIRADVVAAIETVGFLTGQAGFAYVGFSDIELSETSKPVIIFVTASDWSAL